MHVTETSRPAETNPLAEILEPIRRRALMERMERDERDGCVVIDYTAVLEQPGE